MHIPVAIVEGAFVRERGRCRMPLFCRGGYPRFGFVGTSGDLSVDGHRAESSADGQHDGFGIWLPFWYVRRSRIGVRDDGFRVGWP